MPPTAEDTALAYLLLQHEQEQAALASNVKTVTVTRSLNPTPTAPKKQPKAKVAISEATRTHMNGLPAKGTLDAAGFMAAIKAAGRRFNDKGFPYTDHGQVREDTIKAIAAYIGYDPRGNFGAQDIAARAQAQKELGANKVKAFPEGKALRNASHSLGGYVSGIPDTQAKAIAHKRAQAENCLQAIIQHDSAALDMTRSEAERRLSEGLAQLEREKLTHIHTDLRAMGVKP